MSQSTMAAPCGDGLSGVCATTPDARLPRAAALTDALLAAAPKGAAQRDAAQPHDAAVAALGSDLVRGLTGVLAAASRARRAGQASSDAGRPPALVRIGHYQIASALGGPERARRTGRGAGAVRPFRWNSRTARRTIALAALRTGLDGRAPTPSEAVGLVLSDPGGPFGVGRVGPGSCADWVASLAPPARAHVAAEATTWATRLWTALDWGRLDPGSLAVGGADRWWRWSGSAPEAGCNGEHPHRPCRVALRGHADVRLTPASGAGGSSPGGAHLAVLDGEPGASTRQALLLSALVDVLSGARSPGAAPPPARVIGWWPDCGRAWVVPVDARSLAGAANAVVTAAATLLGADAPGECAGDR
ncbi:MAG TPA: hypothetical protein VND62_09810 [Acidimicrobiales bacterium]|nr:hypothetical protein [Acidimicrobiales bacterium]